jgi:hypothetical protein
VDLAEHQLDEQARALALHEAGVAAVVESWSEVERLLH